MRKVRAFFGGNRAGKTRWGAQEVIWHMFKIHPFQEPWPDPLRVRICVTNEKQGIFQVMLPLFKELLPPDSARWRADPKIMEVATGDGQTAEIEFLTYEQDVDKFGGVSRHIVWMDEEPRLRDQYYQNLMRTVDKRGKMLMSMTPLFGVTWAYDEIIEGDPEIVDHEYVTIYDNKFLPLDEIELIERTADPDIKDAILYGRFISPTGLVYKDFETSVHVIDPLTQIPDDWMVVLGIDTHESMRNPQAVVFMAKNPENEWIVFDEILKPCLIPDLAELIKAKLDEWKIMHDYRFMVMDISSRSAVMKGDHGRGVRHDEVLKNCGLKKIKIADKAKGIPQEGRSKIKDLLKWEKTEDGQWVKKPGFFITENCVNSIWQMKRHMYLLDAIRYVVQENIMYRSKHFRWSPPEANDKHLIRGVNFKPKGEVEWQKAILSKT
jgi:phage terminase large subunit-like protein